MMPQSAKLKCCSCDPQKAAANQSALVFQGNLRDWNMIFLGTCVFKMAQQPARNNQHNHRQLLFPPIIITGTTTGGNREMEICYLRKISPLSSFTKINLCTDLNTFYEKHLNREITGKVKRE